MSERYARVAKFIEEYPWAMLVGPLEILLESFELRLIGGHYTPEEIAARIEAAREARPARSEVRQPGAVAVLPVQGVIAHRMNLMTAMSGGLSTQQLGAAVRAAAQDPGISAIVLDIDSPGGSVFGVQEVADVIFRARGAKPIVAVANATAASAAYWIGSQADEFIVTPSGQVGSIGVVAVHVDRSEQAKALGMKHTLISAGKHKTDGSDLAPLDDETRAHMQRRVDQYYSAFVSAVARGRGVSAEAVRNGFGEGRVVGAADALKAGMVDGIRTMDAVIARLAGVATSVSGGARAEAPEILEESHREVPPAAADLRVQTSETPEPWKAELDDMRAKLAAHAARPDSE